MLPADVVARMPYPIARVYADLDDPAAAPQTRREAVCFAGYQLMRVVGLTLIGQYLHQEPPAEAPLPARQALNRAIAALRAPYYSDWIGLLGGLARHGPVLGLDFFPEFAGSMAAVAASRVDVPPTYGVDHGARHQGLTWLEALVALRDGTAHAGFAISSSPVSGSETFYDPLANSPCPVLTTSGPKPSPSDY